VAEPAFAGRLHAGRRQRSCHVIPPMAGNVVAFAASWHHAKNRVALCELLRLRSEESRQQQALHWELS